MADHQLIDRRSLAMVQRIVARVDQQPELLERARATCERWLEQRDNPAHREWSQILRRPWAQVREVLLDPGHEGQRLRQSDPFVGLLSNQERWAILRETR